MINLKEIQNKNSLMIQNHANKAHDKYSQFSLFMRYIYVYAKLIHE